MASAGKDIDDCDLTGFSDFVCGDGGGEFLMTASTASNNCAVPRRCLRSCLDVPDDDFLLAT